MLVIGLTGGIGSGKSTVSDMFEQLGITIIDTDIISREIVLQDLPAYKAIVNRHGSKILLPSGQINRKQLRDIIFSDPAERKWLEDLLHPPILEIATERAKQQQSDYCILVIPLLVESSSLDLVDRVLVVDCNEDLQTKRALTRESANANTIKAIMNSQATRDERLAIADDVITNEGSLNELKEAVQSLHLKYLDLAQQSS